MARVADLDPLELEHTLRGFLLKLQFADAWMKQLPQGAPFPAHLYLHFFLMRVKQGLPQNPNCPLMIAQIALKYLPKEPRSRAHV